MATTTVRARSFIPFLAREESYRTEKPYGGDFPVDHIEGAQVTNHVFDIKEVLLHDVRYAQESFTLDTNGFCFIEAQTSLEAREASMNQTAAMQLYISEILAILAKQFPEYKEIRHMDFQVRKRSPGFPHAHGQSVEYPQPATMPHTDFSADGALMRMADVFPGQKKLYEGRDFDLLNVWRVLKGPNNDWPLAVCDYSSIDWENDTTANDALHLQRVGENWLLHENPQHRWYYKSSMMENDLIVFRNTDSRGVRAKCFHAAFKHPYSTGPPRESIELRVAAFRD